MAVFNQPIHWGHRDVEWTYIPESAEEMAATMRRLFAEALAMLAFVFVAGAAIVNGGEIGLLGMAAATAVGYVVMVSVFQPISGGHINPAVTVGMVAARRMPPSIGILYIAAQFGGAILGALLLNLIFDGFVDDAASAASLSFAGDMDVWIGGLLEAILAFVLVVVYFRAFVDPKGDRSTGALALGMVVLFSFLVAFPLTGAALNVARVFGTDLVAGAWTDFGYYWLGLVGGALAGFLYEHLFAVREEES